MYYNHKNLYYLSFIFFHKLKDPNYYISHSQMAPRRFPIRMQRTSPKSNNNFLLPFEPRLDNSPFPNMKKHSSLS